MCRAVPLLPLTDLAAEQVVGEDGGELESAARLGAGRLCLQPALDGAPLEWEYAADEANIDQVVPPRWDHTRDLSSFQSVHGAVVHAAQDGELTLRLPPLPSPEPPEPRVIPS